LGKLSSRVFPFFNIFTRTVGEAAFPVTEAPIDFKQLTNDLVVILKSALSTSKFSESSSESETIKATVNT